MASSDETTPWYRQFWPWALIALPASAVVGGVATLIIAVYEPDGLVVDDYYKAGLAINQDLERDRLARHLGLSAQVQVDAHSGAVHVALFSTLSVPPRQPLRLSLLHPTRAHQDMVLALQPTAEGTYLGHLPKTPVPGHWHVLLEPLQAGWRLHGRIVLPHQETLQLTAANGY